MVEESSCLYGIGRACTKKQVISKVKKALFVLGCIAGFSYQALDFMTMFWTYPTVIDLNFSTPAVFDAPAISMCSSLSIVASKFCRKLPELCGGPEEYKAFCKKFDACASDMAMPQERMPLVQYAPKLPREQYRQMGADDSHVMGTIYTSDSSNPYITERPEIQWFGVVNDVQLPANCYTLNSLWGNPSGEPKKIHMSFKVELFPYDNKTEYFHANSPQLLFLSIHDPRSLENPIKDGIMLQYGYLYIIYVKQNIRNLLPAPYSSNCRDYRAIWRAKGGRGPLTEKQCTEECVRDLENEAFGCNDSTYPYTGNDSIYCKIYLRQFKTLDISSCYKICKPACNSWDYSLEINHPTKMEISEELRKTRGVLAVIEVRFSRMEIFTYTYLPKYESIEMFSNIGGFLGIWLGYSLLAIIDLLEDAWKFIIYCRKKQREARIQVLEEKSVKRIRKMPLNSRSPEPQWIQVD